MADKKPTINEMVDYIVKNYNDPFYSDIQLYLKRVYGKNYSSIFSEICNGIRKKGVRIWS